MRTLILATLIMAGPALAKNPITESKQMDLKLSTYSELPLVQDLETAWDNILSAESRGQEDVALAIRLANEAFRQLEVKNDKNMEGYRLYSKRLKKALFEGRLEIVELLRRLENGQPFGAVSKRFGSTSKFGCVRFKLLGRGLILGNTVSLQRTVLSYCRRG